MSAVCMRLLAALGAVLCAAAAWSQTTGNPLVRAYPRQVYGGGVGQVFDVAQDDRGLLYFATLDSDLLEFDGERWRSLEVVGLIQALAIDERGRIWMAGANRIGYFANGDDGARRWHPMHPLLPEAERSFSDTWPILPTDRGIFFASREFLFRYRDEPEPHFESWPGSSDQIFYRLYELGGRLLVAQYGVGLLELTDDDRLVRLGGDVLPPDAELNAAFDLEEGRILLFTRLYGAFTLDGDRVEPAAGPAVPWLQENQVQHGCPLPDGRFALATRRGGVAFVDRDLNLDQVVDERSGLTDNGTSAVFIDQRKNLWVATENGVSSIILETATEGFGDENGLPEATITDLVGHEGSLYVATLEGLFQGSYTTPESEEQPSVLFDPTPLLESQVWELLTLGDGLLAATTDGLFDLRTRRRTGFSLSSASQLSTVATTSLLAYPGLAAGDGDEPNQVILGMAGGLGLAERDGDVWRFVRRLPGLQQDVWGLALGGDGEIIASEPGQSRLAILRFSDGLDAEPEVHFFALPATPSPMSSVGDRLILSLDGTLQRYLGLDAVRSADAFETDQELANLAALGADGILLEDRKKRLWVTTPRGLRLATRLESGGFELQPISSQLIESPDVVVEDPYRPDTFWIGGVDGLLRTTPQEGQRPAPAPVSLVRRVQALGTDREIDDGSPGQRAPQTLEWEENALRFEFAAPVFEQSLEMLYRVRLDGFDAIWTDWSPESFKEYTSLGEGRYAFRVQAQDALGTLGPVATWSFRILPPWYRTPWAFAGYIASGVGLVFLLVLGRTRRLDRRRAILEQLVGARTRELAEGKDQVERQARDLERVNQLLAEENEHRRYLEAERAKLQERNEQSEKLESLGLMAGGVAHDFNNILMAILGNADLCLEEDGLSPNLDRRLNAISDAGRRAAELCQQMLAYAGKGSFEERDIDLSALAAETLEILRVSIADSTRITTDLSPDIPAVSGDPSKISQLVLNLMTNAAEAIGQGGGELRVTTGVRHLDGDDHGRLALAEPIPEGPYVFVQVRDDGEGMDEETRRRLFDPFFTTKFAGRGLGMAAALGILRSHGGAISVDSEPGRGTTVEAYFPALDHPVGDPTSRTPEAVRRWRPTGTILVVDDEAVVRDVVELILRNTGFDVLTAASGSEAIEIYRAEGDRFAGVIMDLTMPGLDGLATFEKLRDMNPDIKVLLSSGYSGDTLIERYLEKGFAGFIAKPYRPSALRSALREALGGRRANAELE